MKNTGPLTSRDSEYSIEKLYDRYLIREKSSDQAQVLTIRGEAAKRIYILMYLQERFQRDSKNEISRALLIAHNCHRTALRTFQQLDNEYLSENEDFCDRIWVRSRFHESMITGSEPLMYQRTFLNYHCSHSGIILGSHPVDQDRYVTFDEDGYPGEFRLVGRDKRYFQGIFNRSFLGVPNPENLKFLGLHTVRAINQFLMEIENIDRNTSRASS